MEESYKKAKRDYQPSSSEEEKDDDQPDQDSGEEDFSDDEAKEEDKREAAFFSFIHGGIATVKYDADTAKYFSRRARNRAVDYTLKLEALETLFTEVSDQLKVKARSFFDSIKALKNKLYSE